MSAFSKKQESLIVSLKKTLQKETAQLKHIAINRSFEFDNNRVEELKKQLTNRQFFMKIIEYLDGSMFTTCQIINKRFYEGITPHWMNFVKKIKISVRVTDGRHELL